MNNALEIKNVTKRFPGFTLDGLTLALPTGCIMGFIGENGAGKSTTIRMLLDLISRDEGEISVLGQDLRHADRSLREQIGVVLDECGFPDTMNLGDIRRILKGIYRTWNMEGFNARCAAFSLPEKKAVKDFSRGMKMKLSLAVALSHDSKLLILDEATSGLDPVVRNEILDVFLDFIQDETHSIFLSSHILSDLEKVCDYIAFIHQGKLIFCQEKNALMESYAVAKCTFEEFERLDKACVIGHRQNSFGVDALVRKDRLNIPVLTDNASIEDIMLYYIKEKAQ